MSPLLGLPLGVPGLGRAFYRLYSLPPALIGLDRPML